MMNSQVGPKGKADCRRQKVMKLGLKGCCKERFVPPIMVHARHLSSGTPLHGEVDI